MQRRPIGAFLICLGLVAVATGAGVVLARSLRPRSIDSDIAQNRGLVSDMLPADGVAGIEPDPLPEPAGEISRLEGEIEGLRRQLAAPVPTLLPAREAFAAMPRPNNPWNNEGRGTTASTFRTVQWAIHVGDVDALENAIALDPEAERDADAFFAALDDESKAEFESPQRLVASAMAAKSWSNLTAADITSEAMEPDGTMQVRMSIMVGKSKPREITLRFRNRDDGWRLLVPAKIVTSYRNLLLGPVVDPKTYKVIRH